MEFLFSENECKQLCENMLVNLKEIACLISEIRSENGLLKGALGEDSAAVEKSVHDIEEELTNTYSAMNVIVNDIQEYIARVHQVKVTLWN